MPARPDLEQLLRRQSDVIARHQALRFLGRRALECRIDRGGRWQVILPGTYGAFTGKPTETQRLWAAVLYASDPKLDEPDAFVTGLAGARAHGLRDLPPERKADVVTRRQVRSTDFVRARRSQRPTATLLIDGVPTAGLARCVVDAAIRLPRLDDVRALVAEAVMRRGLPVEDLVDELAGAPMRGSAFLRRALGEVATGARSVPECKVMRIFGRSKVLPPLHYNCSLMGPEGWIADPDAYCEESGVAQEIDSVKYHIKSRAWAATMARRSRMVSHGVRVLEADPGRAGTDPVGILRQFERAHAIGLRSGPPPGVWVRCREGCTVNQLRKKSR